MAGIIRTWFDRWKRRTPPQSGTYFISGSEVGYRDPLSYPHVGLDALQSPDRDVIWLEHEARPYPAEPRPPAFHDREAKPVCPDLVSPPRHDGPASYVMARSWATLAGYRALIGGDNEYNLDESFLDDEHADRTLTRFDSVHQHENEWIGFKAAAGHRCYELGFGTRAVETLDRTVICLSSNEAPNYGSFIFRILPKVQRIMQMDDAWPILLPLYSPSMRELLVLAGIPDSRLLHQDVSEKVYQIRRAIVPSMPNRDLWLDDASLRLFDRLRDSYGEKRGTRRIYLSRRDYMRGNVGQVRIMLNEADLIEALELRGFEIIEPQMFDAKQQIALFSSASFIVSASGSALFNTVFCHPGTRLIDIESEPHWVLGHINLFGSRGLEYGIFEGAPENHDFSVPHIPYRVDIKRLLERIDAWL